MSTSLALAKSRACGRRVALAEVFGQGGVGVGIVALELGQEPLDGDGHELGSAEGGHVAEDVGRIESLSGDVEVEVGDEFRGDVVEDLCGEVVVAEELSGSVRGCGVQSVTPGSVLRAYWTSEWKM